jgi:hypothetical protein
MANPVGLDLDSISFVVLPSQSGETPHSGAAAAAAPIPSAIQAIQQSSEIPVGSDSHSPKNIDSFLLRNAQKGNDKAVLKWLESGFRFSRKELWPTFHHYSHRLDLTDKVGIEIRHLLEDKLGIQY